MGNFCGTSSNKKHAPSSPPTPQEQQSTDVVDTTRSNTPFLVTPDPLGLGGVGSSSPSSSSRVEFVDSRLLSLLEFFRQLHFRRRDIFTQIIPVHRRAFEDIFDKMDKNTNEEEGHEDYIYKGLKKSRSSDDLKLEKFKVKPINSPNDKVQGGGGGGGGGSKPKPAGSK